MSNMNRETVMAMNHYKISVKPVRGGFIVEYPTFIDGYDNHPIVVEEVTTSLGKAMRLVKAAAEEFSLVKKSDDEAV